MIRPHYTLLITLTSLVLGSALASPKLTTIETKPSFSENPKLIRQHTQLVDSTPLSGDVLYRLLVAEMAGQQDQLSTAIEEYVKITKKTKDPVIAERATQIALYAGDFKSALITAKIWAQAAEDNLEAQHILITLLLKTNQAKETLTPFYRAFLITTKQETPSQSFSQFVEQIATAVPEQSEIILSVLKKLNKKRTNHNTELLLAIASLALSNNQLEEAQKATEQVLSTNPQQAEATFLQARILLAENNIPAALSLLAKSAQTFPNHYGIQTFYAKLLLKMNELGEAENQYMKLLKQYPQDTNLLLGLTLIKIEQQQYQTAQKLIQQIEQALPNNPILQFYKGYLAEKRGQYALALKTYTALMTDSKMFVASIQAAIVLAKQNKPKEALQLLQTVTPADEEEITQLAITKANLLRTMGQEKEALSILDAAIKSYPNHGELLYARALVLEKIGDLERVEKDFRALLKLNPNDVEILNALGYVLADKTDRYKEALELVSRALQLKPNDPSILDSLGWVHYRLKNYEKALTFLRQAYQLNPQPEIAGHLGEVLWVTSKKTEAENLWQKAKQQDPNNAILNGIIQKWKGTPNP